MKKSVFFFVAILITTVISAQTSENRLPDACAFYGVNFTQINVVGASEPNPEFVKAFNGINSLFLSESNKYNIGGYLGININSYNIEYSARLIDGMLNTQFQNRGDYEIDLQQVMNDYPIIDEDILVLVATEYKKPLELGKYIVLIFNPTTKQIVYQKAIQGTAGGFGLRNY